MPPRPKFCSHCGSRLERRPVGGRERDVCSGCQAVFSENPIPAFSAVVVDTRRQVLLVRREGEPQRGRWSLPMMFPEPNEPIEQAVLHKLHKDTGIQGRVTGLLSVDTLQTDFHGPLMVLAVEIEPLAGQVTPASDISEAAYHSLGDPPPLAFASDMKALQTFRDSHKEAWAIQDSFSNLQSDEQEHDMLSDVLLRMLTEHADQVAQFWLEEVRTSGNTPTYHTLEPQALVERAVIVLQQFGRWLKSEQAGSEIKDFYRALGRQRRSQGAALTEVLTSLMLLRKNIWAFVRRQGILSKPLDAYRALELDRRLIAFFDKAMRYVAEGFEGSKAP
jgi:8-oxo-dGTP diphosphatase